VNVAANHIKGHQNAKGRIIEDGDFISSFEPSEYIPEWKAKIKTAIRNVDAELQVAIRAADDGFKKFCLQNRHSDNLVAFYCTVGNAAQFLSHSTCFCCLMQAPQHVLRCGHGKYNISLDQESC
jgi:hypothetical protein